MRLVRYDGDSLGVWTADGIVDLTDDLDADGEPLVAYAASDLEAADYADADPDHAREDVRIEAPVGRPGKVIAAPLNYEEHVAEMEGFDMDIKEAGYFLKAPSSVIGPEETVVLPFSDRRCDYEVELAFVVGEDAKDVTSEDAWDHILGYTILLDISVRGDQDRSNRKSYDTFTVIGPCVATGETVGDPNDLDIRLELNGETRQQATTGDMIYDPGEILQYATIGTTVERGDVVTTGTPSGVGELSDGDTVHAELESVGSMTVDVEERDVRFEAVDVK